MKGRAEPRGPDWWQAADGRWYPPAEEVARRRETLVDMVLVAGTLFVVTLVTYLVLSR